MNTNNDERTKEMVDKVSLERGEPHQREVLENLIQLYIHDFNDFLAPERKIGVEEDGRFADVLKLERYWTEADRAVWFIRAGVVMTASRSTPTKLRRDALPGSGLTATPRGR